MQSEREMLMKLLPIAFIFMALVFGASTVWHVPCVPSCVRAVLCALLCACSSCVCSYVCGTMRGGRADGGCRDNARQGRQKSMGAGGGCAKAGGWSVPKEQCMSKSGACAGAVHVTAHSAPALVPLAHPPLPLAPSSLPQCLGCGACGSGLTQTRAYERKAMAHAYQSKEREERNATRIPKQSNAMPTPKQTNAATRPCARMGDACVTHRCISTTPSPYPDISFRSPQTTRWCGPWGMRTPWSRRVFRFSPTLIPAAAAATAAIGAVGPLTTSTPSSTTITSGIVRSGERLKKAGGKGVSPKGCSERGVAA